LLPGRIMMGAFRAFRARSHQAHVPAKNIPKLRQFGDAELPEQPLKTRTVLRIVIDIEAQHGELRAPPSDTSFPTEGAPGGDAESHGTSPHDRQRGYGQNKAQRKIQRAFADPYRRQRHLSELE